MKNNEKGFSVVEILIVAVVVGLLGAVGWFVYDRQSNGSKSNQTSQQNSSEQTGTIEQNQNSVNEENLIKTNTITNAKFSVNLPSDWNYRSCMDHDGLGVLVAGGGGDMKCLFDDADWLGKDMATRGKVVIGYNKNPYPRQDWSSGQQKDLYESDAKDVKLKDGQTVKKYEYMSEESANKGKTFKTVEYTLNGKVTVFVFDGSSAESSYINELPTEDVLRIVEETILPSIKLL
jgi:type II secretory pathway pseudopilin PulG